MALTDTNLPGGGTITINDPAVSGAAGARIDANDEALAAAITAHAALTNNPHGVTRAQLGLAGDVWVDQVTLDGTEALVEFSGAVSVDTFTFEVETAPGSWQGSGGDQTQEAADTVRVNGGSGFSTIAQGQRWRLASTTGVLRTPQFGVIT